MLFIKVSHDHKKPVCDYACCLFYFTHISSCQFTTLGHFIKHLDSYHNCRYGCYQWLTGWVQHALTVSSSMLTEDRTESGCDLWHNHNGPCFWSRGPTVASGWCSGWRVSVVWMDCTVREPASDKALRAAAMLTELNVHGLRWWLTELVFGLWSQFTRRSLHARLQVSTCSSNDLDHPG